uniref:Ketoreductase domain-containing protein n=1 Tax=Geospiza parvula TaxID=87175 RepID=A0A8C3MEL6_GEOPR
GGNWERTAPGGGRGDTMAAPPGRTVLVTGCSSGIGLAVAVLLARDPQRRYLGEGGSPNCHGRAPSGDTLRILRLDVTSDSSVAECLAQVPGGRVDVVVNNAGVGLVGPLESASGPQVQRVFDTNVFGVLRLARALLPQMKRRRSGHIVVVSSVMGLQGVVFNDVYSASKFAVEGLCESLAVQLLQFNPGPVNTELSQGSAGGGKIPISGTGAETPRYFQKVYLPASRDVFDTFGQSPEEVAQAIVSVIGARRPPFRTPTNPLYSPLLALRFADPRGDLGVRTFQRLLFDLGPAFHLSLALLRCLTCRCCRRRVTPV